MKTFVEYVVREFVSSNSQFLPSESLGFTTPAQLITLMLKEIKINHLDESESAEDMKKRINYAIEKLNSRSGLFSIDYDPRFEQNIRGKMEERKQERGVRSAEVIVEADDGNENVDFSSSESEEGMDSKLKSGNKENRTASAVSAYRRRRSVQVGTNWLQEFSSVNMGLI